MIALKADGNRINAFFLPVFDQREGFPVSSIHLCPLLGRNRANFKLRQAGTREKPLFGLGKMPIRIAQAI